MTKKNDLRVVITLRKEPLVFDVQPLHACTTNDVRRAMGAFVTALSTRRERLRALLDGVKRAVSVTIQSTR
jgi:hypothetical protein